MFTFLLSVTVKQKGRTAVSEPVEKTYPDLRSLLIDVAEHLPGNEQLGVVPIGITIKLKEPE